MQPVTSATLSPKASGLSFQDTLTGKVSIVVAASLFLAVCAHLSMPLPFTPVPLTMQPFGVLLLGLMLGPSTAFAAVVLYLLEGAAGMPVFTPQGPVGLAHFFGPTAGYLLSYPLAAGLAALSVRTLPFRSVFTRAVVAGTLATTVILAAGALWLSQWAHTNLFSTLTLSVFPFLPGEAMKITAAAGITSVTRRAMRR
ncbi:MAG: biotin transporter BioY [Acidobacteriota bacterium]|nr:biotin transporter BioY [Acidobacteriota bacterium]